MHLNGQLKVGPGADLDFEGAVMSYAVTVEVERRPRTGRARRMPRPDDAIAVTVNVTDLTEPPAAPAAPTLTPTATTLAGRMGPSRTTRGPAITG